MQRWMSNICRSSHKRSSRDISPIRQCSCRAYNLKPCIPSNGMQGFSLTRYELSACLLVYLSTWYEIGNAVLVLLQFIVEQPFLTINGLGLSRQGQCHYFQDRKLGNRTTAWNSTRFVDGIFRGLFAYVKDVGEVWVKVVHTMGWT